jgi:4'-phosphopantetheinyl transferase
MLASDSNEPLAFNFSRSKDLALLAVRKGGAVGIDLELLRPFTNMASVARMSFSAQEYKDWQALPLWQQTAGFYRCWTCKEAFVKAKGTGLSANLESFDVAVDPDLPAELLANRDPLATTDRWFLSAFTPAPNYTAALALHGTDARVILLQNLNSLFANDKTARILPAAQVG